jgi:hypothetical protein
MQLFADLMLANEADVAIISSASAKAPGWFVSLVHRFEPVASGEVTQACEQLIALAE